MRGRCNPSPGIEGSRLRGVLIIVEIRFYREGLAAGLSRWKELGEIRTVSACDTAVGEMRRSLPGVVLLDAAVRGRQDLMAYVSAAEPAPRVVILGLLGEPSEVIACAEGGATAYVTRDSSLAQVASVIGRAVRGDLLCTPDVSGALMRRVATLAGDAAGEHAIASLTSREAEVLALIRVGMSNKEIGRELYIELATVKNHVHNILEKLGVSRRQEAAALLTADFSAIDDAWPTTSRRLARK
jgi:DNA-binding NarL/FixJ family response regulator